jgi:hypothetical protein
MNREGTGRRWWGEAPDRPQGVRKALIVVQPAARRTDRLPSRGRARGNVEANGRCINRVSLLLFKSQVVHCGGILPHDGSGSARESA